MAALRWLFTDPWTEGVLLTELRSLQGQGLVAGSCAQFTRQGSTPGRTVLRLRLQGSLSPVSYVNPDCSGFPQGPALADAGYVCLAQSSRAGRTLKWWIAIHKDDWHVAREGLSQ